MYVGVSEVASLRGYCSAEIPRISLVLEGGGSTCNREMKPFKISSNKEGGFFQ